MGANTLKRIETKTRFFHFLQVLKDEFELSPRTASAILEVARDIFQLNKVDSSLLGNKGKVIRTVVSSTAKHGPPMEDLPKIEVVLTLNGGKEDEDVRRRQGNKALRQHRILRMVDECGDQGGSLSEEDLADILKVSSRTIRRDIKDLKEAGFIVATRGIIHDIGPSISHKTKIVKLYLESKTYSEISLISRHSPYSIKRYIKSFTRIIFLYKKGFKISGIRYCTGISARTIKEYLDLYRECIKSEYRDRIRDLLTITEVIKKGASVK